MKNVYLDEFSQEEEIKQAMMQGCLKMTMILIALLTVAILAMVFSCGSTNHNKGCEAYGNGKTY